MYDIGTTKPATTNHQKPTDIVSLFLDNDLSGKKATKQLLADFHNSVDMSAIYGFKKDLSEYLTALNRRQHRLQWLAISGGVNVALLASLALLQSSQRGEKSRLKVNAKKIWIMNVRTKYISFRVSNTEKKAIAMAAEECSLSISEFS